MNLAIKLAFTTVYCAATTHAAEVVFPGAEWESKAPPELGLDEARLEAVADALGSRGCAIKNGYVVKTWGAQDEKGDLFSSAKPVLSTLLMFAVKEGKVKDFDQPLVDFGWPLEPKDRTMTLRHLASMTSGYARPEEPGKAWAYNDYAIQLYQQTLFDKIFQAPPEDGLSRSTAVRRTSIAGRVFLSPKESTHEGVGPRLRPRRVVLAESGELERKATAPAVLFRRQHAAASPQGFGA